MTKRSMRSSVALACRRGVAILGLGIAGVIVSAGVAAADDDALGNVLTGDTSLQQTLASATEPALGTVGTTEQVLAPVVDVVEPAVTVIEPVSEATEPVTMAVQSDVSSLVDTVPVAEVVNPVITVVDPVVEVVDPVAEVLDPVVEVVDPVVEVVDPVVEVVDPVVEVLDPLVEVVDSVVDVVDPVVEVVDPVVEVLDPVVEVLDPIVDVVDPVVEVVDPVVELLDPVVPSPAPPSAVDAPAVDHGRDVETVDTADRVTSYSPGGSADEPTAAASAPTDTIHTGASLVAVSSLVADKAAAQAVAHVRADPPVDTSGSARVGPAPLAVPISATTSSSAGVGGPTRGSVDAWSYDRLSLPASVAGSLAIAENLRAPRAPFLEIPTSPA